MKDEIDKIFDDMVMHGTGVMKEGKHVPLDDIFSNIPSTWECVRCGGVHANGPFDEMPVAFEIKTDPKTGRQSHGGDICKKCYDQKSK